VERLSFLEVPAMATVTCVCDVCGKEFERPLKRHNQWLRVGSKGVACGMACNVKLERERRSIAERFWEKVDVRGPDECWEWKAGRRTFGYGGFGTEDGKSSPAHRVAWELTHGPIPPGDGYHGTCVLHRCDNPPCVNPAHLFLGTNADNARDKAEKGRVVSNVPRGEANCNAKLTNGQVLEIRAHPEITGIEFSRRFGVTPMVVSNIRNGKTWKHLSLVGKPGQQVLPF
jgi:hypothetical protein